MAELKKTGPYKEKMYQCEGCGRHILLGTNHWGECYPVCRACGKQTVHKCLEPMPEGYTAPEKWTMVKLGDLIEIK